MGVGQRDVAGGAPADYRDGRDRGDEGRAPVPPWWRHRRSEVFPAPGGRGRLVGLIRLRRLLRILRRVLRRLLRVLRRVRRWLLLIRRAGLRRPVLRRSVLRRLLLIRLLR